MSLINDALQDLEARTPSRERSSVGSPGLSLKNSSRDDQVSGTRSSTPTRRAARAGVAGGALLGTAFTAAVLWWSPWQSIDVHRNAQQATISFRSEVSDRSTSHQASLKPSAKNHRQAVATTLSVSEVFPEKSEENTVTTKVPRSELSPGSFISATQKAPPAAYALASESSMQAPQTQQESARSQDKIAAFLIKAAAAFERNQLSVPAHNNALYFIERVFAEDPSHPTALALLSAVQDSYRTQIAAAIAAEDVAQASTLLSRHQVFQLRATSFAQEFAAIATLKATQQKLEGEKIASAPLDSTQKEKDEREISASSQQQPASWVEISAASLDRKQVDTTQSAMGTARQAAAIEQLEAFVLTNKNALLSTLFLADYYADSKNNTALLGLLAQLPRGHKALNYIRAKHLALSQDIEGAIAVLTSQAADPVIARELQTYLGGLYHSTQQYAQARDIYQALLRTEPNDAKVLLGFALANDALGEVQHSLSAYRELLRLGHRNQTVVAFVEQRVQTLMQSQKLEAALW